MKASELFQVINAVLPPLLSWLLRETGLNREAALVPIVAREFGTLYAELISDLSEEELNRPMPDLEKVFASGREEIREAAKKRLAELREQQA